MSLIRSYIPEYINDTVMYYTGTLLYQFQYYYDTTFSASEITPRIFVGDLASAMNIEELKKTGITHIVSAINGAYPLFPDDIKYKIVNINDDPWVDIGQYFDSTNKFIDDVLSIPDTKVMIHCQRGVSRSVTLLLSYLIFKKNQKQVIPKENVIDIINETLTEVKTCRPIAEPNHGFIDALKTYIYRLNKYQ